MGGPRLSHVVANATGACPVRIADAAGWNNGQECPLDVCGAEQGLTGGQGAHPTALILLLVIFLWLDRLGRSHRRYNAGFRFVRFSLDPPAMDCHVSF